MINLISKLYGSLTKLRRKIFKPFYNPLVPVVCIGNIQVGGTGKTPTTINIARYLLEKGVRPFVVLRGYKGKEIGPSLVDRLDPKLYGDEALIYFRNGIDTIVSKNRISGIEFAQNMGAHIILCDDGFQDLRINYKKKILCFKPFEKNRDFKPFPAGILRESLENTKYADYVFLTKTNLYSKDIVERTLDILSKYNSNIFSVPIKLESIKNFFGIDINIENIIKQNIYLLSGIGNPKSFENLIKKELNKDIKHHFIFQDHFNYNINNLKKIFQNLNKNDILLTTEKDFVKIFELLKDKDINWKEKIYVVKTKFDVPRKVKKDILNLLKNLEKIDEKQLNLEANLEIKNETYRNCRSYERR